MFKPRRVARALCPGGHVYPSAIHGGGFPLRTARRSDRSLLASLQAVSVHSPPAWPAGAACSPGPGVRRLPAESALTGQWPQPAACRVLPDARRSASIPSVVGPRRLLATVPSSCQHYRSVVIVCQHQRTNNHLMLSRQAMSMKQTNFVEFPAPRRAQRASLPGRRTRNAPPPGRPPGRLVRRILCRPGSAPAFFWAFSRKFESWADSKPPGRAHRAGASGASGRIAAFETVARNHR